MKFTKLQTGEYVATGSDGRLVTVRRTDWDDTPSGMEWGCYYEGDDSCDETAYASTKKELVNIVNNMDRV